LCWRRYGLVSEASLFGIALRLPRGAWLTRGPG
jgi:hypothetical protein